MKQVAVIGSGFGGLALAIRLQSAGFATTVIEAREKPGGRAYYWNKDGHIFDAGPTVITDPDCLKELWALSGADIAQDVDLLPVSPFYRLSWPDGSIFDYLNDDEQLTRQIAALDPRDVDGYRRFLDYSAGVFEEGYVKLGAVPFLDFKSMLRAAPQLARYQAWRSVYSVVSGFVHNEKLRQALSFHTLLVGGNPMTTSSIYALIHKLERDGGVWFARGGTNRLISGMVTHFERLGGKLRLDDGVQRIGVEDGQARTVVRRGGVQRRCASYLRNDRPSARAQGSRQAPAQKLFAVLVRGALFGPRRVAGRAAPFDPVRSPLRPAAQRHLQGQQARGRPVHLSSPPDRDRPRHGAAGQVDLLRAGAGSASGPRRHRLGTRKRTLRQAAAADHRGADDAGPVRTA
jgi:phytoene dehydrogenase-like protein